MPIFATKMLAFAINAYARRRWGPGVIDPVIT